MMPDTYNILIEHKLQCASEEEWLEELKAAKKALAKVACPNIKAVINNEIEATINDIRIRDEDVASTQQ